MASVVLGQLQAQPQDRAAPRHARDPLVEVWNERPQWTPGKKWNFARRLALIEAYQATFPNDLAVLDDMLNHRSVRLLAAIRNVLVYSGGIADAKFINETEGDPRVSVIAETMPVILSGRLVGELMTDTIDQCHILLGWVDAQRQVLHDLADAWLTSPPDPRALRDFAERRPPPRLLRPDPALAIGLPPALERPAHRLGPGAASASATSATAPTPVPPVQGPLNHLQQAIVDLLTTDGEAKQVGLSARLGIELHAANAAIAGLMKLKGLTYCQGCGAKLRLAQSL